MEESRHQLIAAVGAAMRAYQRATDALDDAVADRFGINRTDLRHLDLLYDGPLSAGHLSERSGLSPAAMTTLIDRLERKGYVRRVRDAGDRRRVFVELTDLARTAAGEMYGPLAEEGTQLLDTYTDDQLTLIRDVLDADRDLTERHHKRIRSAPPVTP
ncbi:MAG TPA: MarR family transcriptional regulator [Pseudonocardiaceae bacterium]|jgi:DNA-binding MarR family transcriptional regulator|nr:MarR family transcriptional regulator [Pseudonocardiaceae bacterium]